MLNIHVIIGILSLPVLLFPVLSMHNFDAFRSFHLLFRGYLLLFALFGRGLLHDRVAKVEVRDFSQHKGGQIVGVLTVTSAILRIKAVAATNHTEYLHVLGEEGVESPAETLLILGLIELNLARKHILEGVDLLISACGPIPSYLLEVTKVIVGDGTHLMEGLLDFLFDRADVRVFLRAREVAPVVAHYQSDSGLWWIGFATWDSRLIFLVRAICSLMLILFTDIKVRACSV
jgi:hypothetical protein